MILQCRHCWKKVIPWIGLNSHHVEARCPECGGWIKFLTRNEIAIVLKAILLQNKIEKPKIKRSNSRNVVITRKPQSAAMAR